MESSKLPKASKLLSDVVRVLGFEQTTATALLLNSARTVFTMATWDLPVDSEEPLVLISDQY